MSHSHRKSHPAVAHPRISPISETDHVDTTRCATGPSGHRSGGRNDGYGRRFTLPVTSAYRISKRGSQGMNPSKGPRISSGVEVVLGLLQVTQPEVTSAGNPCAAPVAETVRWGTSETPDGFPESLNDLFASSMVWNLLHLC
jgi:hypothetical protein